MAQGAGGGRPLKFKSVKKLQKQIDAYFESCYDYARDMWGNRWIDKEAGLDENGNPYYVKKKVKAFTITGLAIALGTTRNTLLEYENSKYDDREELTEEQAKTNAQIEKFSNTIKAAKQKCYEDTEQYLFRGHATGAIFSLKNNYGWVDKQIVTDEDIPNPFANLTEAELRALSKRSKHGKS
jgi:hypothetical protein